MNKEVSFSSVERVFLTMAIDCLVDRITVMMWDLDSGNPLDRPTFDYLDELRFRIDTMKDKINA